MQKYCFSGVLSRNVGPSISQLTEMVVLFDPVDKPSVRLFPRDRSVDLLSFSIKGKQYVIVDKFIPGTTRKKTEHFFIPI